MDGKKEGRFEKDVSLIVKLLRGPRRRSKTKEKESKQQQQQQPPPGSQSDSSTSSTQDEEPVNTDGAKPVVKPALSESAVAAHEKKLEEIAKLQKDGLPKAIMKSSPLSSPRSSPRSSRSPAVSRGRIPVPTNSPARSPAAMRARSLYASPSRSPGPYRGMYIV